MGAAISKASKARDPEKENKRKPLTYEGVAGSAVADAAGEVVVGAAIVSGAGGASLVGTIDLEEDEVPDSLKGVVVESGA